MTPTTCKGRSARKAARSLAPADTVLLDELNFEGIGLRRIFLGRTLVTNSAKASKQIFNSLNSLIELCA